MVNKRSITSSICFRTNISSEILKKLNNLNLIDFEYDNNYKDVKCLSVTYHIQDAIEVAEVLKEIEVYEFNNLN